MVETSVRAVTADEEKKIAAEAQLDAILKPHMEGQRFQTDDGTIKPQAPAQEEKTTGAPQEASVYETEYQAAATAQDKAQVAAKHGDWQKAYGNAQNALGEVRVRAETFEQQLEAERSRSVPPVQQPQQTQQNPYQAFDNFQVVQPKDEYDDQATRMNEAFKGYTMQLGQALEQRYGNTINQLTQTIEGIKRMPQNYAVDAATEATLVNELNLGNLPEWQQKSIVQRIAGQKTSSNTNTTAQLRQTPQEKAIQRAVN
ncbi:hypothetical protein LCGC14_2314240, partial [marine sediment metagenome]